MSSSLLLMGRRRTGGDERARPKLETQQSNNSPYLSGRRSAGQMGISSFFRQQLLFVSLSGLAKDNVFWRLVGWLSLFYWMLVAIMLLVLPTYVPEIIHDFFLLARHSSYFLSTFHIRKCDVSSRFRINVDMSDMSWHICRHMQLRLQETPTQWQHTTERRWGRFSCFYLRLGIRNNELRIPSIPQSIFKNP